MPRNDGRTRGGDVFGKPRTTYPEGSLTHPTIVEEVEAQTESAAKAFLTAHDVTAAALLVAQQKEKGDNEDGALKEVYMTLPGPVVTEAIKFDNFGNQLEVTAQDVQRSGLSLTNSVTTSQEYRGVDAIRGKKITTTYPVSFAQVTEIEKVDANVPGSRATIYTYLVDAGSSIPADTSTTTYERHKFDDNPDLKIEIKTVYSIPSTFEETEGQAHSFPEIYRLALEDSNFGLYYNFTPARGRVVGCRVQHSFGTTKQDIDVTIIEEAQWRYPLGFSGHGLTNEETLTFTKGGATLILDLPASIPDATTYDTWVGADTELFIGGSSRIWRAGIYITTKIYTKAI